jgi:hypothetical protein
MPDCGVKFPDFDLSLELSTVLGHLFPKIGSIFGNKSLILALISKDN